VEDLFDLYSYRLPPEGSFSNAAILYGDNGVGKTTILMLAFHLLSPANNRGHRTQLYKAPFKRFEVGLSSGIVLTANKTEKQAVGALDLSIRKGTETLAEWLYIPGHKEASDESSIADFEIAKDGKLRLIVAKKTRSAGQVPTGEQAYLKALQECAPRLFMLNADRRLSSDSLPDSTDDVDLRNLTRYVAETKRFADLAAPQQ
jgi:hypothetical protein